ncbi:MAG TPA: type 1 glutamine amidotransferase [Bacteroidales bacterium]|nr:type 1 glutamine amidotransferase [Bacteroidales bacterium]
MIIQFFQHVPFESPGHILEVCQRSGYKVNTTRLYANEALPASGSFDALVVMGGPMSIHDEETYPWLTGEKRFIRETIESGKKIFGFCLGAQLIASALGAEVKPGLYTEIGWYPVKKSMTGDVPGFLPDVFTVFHWHGDTFSLPRGARLLYSSDATPCQAFLYGDNVVALQFHPEMTRHGISDLAEHCSNELTDGPYIMKKEELLNGHALYHRNGYKMIDGLFRYYLD